MEIRKLRESLAYYKHTQLHLFHQLWSVVCGAEAEAHCHYANRTDLFQKVNTVLCNMCNLEWI